MDGLKKKTENIWSPFLAKDTEYNGYKWIGIDDDIKHTHGVIVNAKQLEK